jgi:hypothetical protein
MGFFDFLKRKRVEKIFPSTTEQPQNNKKYQETLEKISPSTTEKPKNGKQNQERAEDFVSFLKELAKYYMSFLETDFHKHKRPRRCIKYHDEKNPDFKIGINLSKYPEFYAKIQKITANNFQEDSIAVPKGKYRMEMPSGLRDLLQLQINNLIVEATISPLISSISEKIAEVVAKYPEEYDTALNTCHEQVFLLIKKYLVTPLIKQVEKPIQNMNLGDENTIFLMEEELTEVIVNLLDDQISDNIKLLLAKEEINVNDSLKMSFQLDDLVNAVISFFETIQFTDLYTEIFEIDRCKNIQENKEFYLYFGDITYGGTTYPVFYIPLNLHTEDNKHILCFDSQIFINKKALEYITQEFTQETKKTGTLRYIQDRIIYINGSEESPIIKVTKVFDEICNFFELNGTISLYDSIRKALKTLFVQLSNSYYIMLFDKADEALINDYEELLNLPQESELVGAFSQITKEFINKDPENFNEAIYNEWQKTETRDKLVAQCPIALNEEQRCILSALKHPGSHIIKVDGPPGTGKSHTITAVVFGAILENKSVLVLSDKKEALDVVEGKITSTMNQVRHDEQFQNPILRLGKERNTYKDILAPDAIVQIEKYYKAIRSSYDSLEQGISKLSDSLKENIRDEIQAYCEINIHDIVELCELDKEVLDCDSPIVIEEALKIPDSAVELQEFRNTFNRLAENVNFYDDFKFSIFTKIDNEYLDRFSKLIEIIGMLEKARTPDIFADQGVSLLHSIEVPTNHKFHRDISAITDFLKYYQNMMEKLKQKKVWEVFQCNEKFINEFSDVEKLLLQFLSIVPIVEKVKSVFSDSISAIDNLTIPNNFDFMLFKQYIENYHQLRARFLGFLFKGNQVKEMDLKFKKAFPYLSLKKPHKNLKHLKKIMEILHYAFELKGDFSDSSATVTSYLHFVIASIQLDTCDEMKEISELLETNKVKLSKIFQYEWLQKLGVKTFELLARIDALAQFLFICDKAIELKIDGIDHLLRIDDGFYNYLLTVNLVEIKRNLEKHKEVINQILIYKSDIQYLHEHLPKYPKTLDASGINLNTFSTLCKNRLTELPESTFNNILIRYISLWQQIEEGFLSLPSINYGNNMKLMEQLVTAQMTYILDGRVLKFHKECQATAKTLRKIIREKRRFPKEEFAKLKDAFPCILASVRDFAEYIPLLPGIFDIVIIDEASQVSIAQAFPALLRGKKVLILGDNKQFSNIKAAQAMTDVNKEYMNNLESTFRRCVSVDQTKLVKLANFNIKTSVLDFTESINNYTVQLQKHFRCYKELISYSNETFYNKSLQVMKIRGKHINEVIKFTSVPNDGKRELVPKTNSPEADFIMSELQKLVAKGCQCSVGVITPHTNQQKMIYQRALQLPESKELFEKYRLKVMTFDTCQGEERDIIYYSMVATDQDDRLGYIFPKDLSNIDFDGDGKIRVQRLNVGFSRTKECMHFVLSRDINNYSGSIGEALKHYNTILKESKKELLPNVVDKNSPMEANVLNWLYQTNFWKEKHSSIELIPQFPIGEYLQQLEQTYNHPKYKVDFLLIYNDGSYEHKVILEYDGFKEHFTDLDAVNQYNYQYYYRDDDLYREKILEGYGYRFLRINRFNLGENPIATLNDRIEKLVERKHVDNTFLSQIHSMISQLDKGQMKECPKCNKVQPKENFYDASLSQKYGRICIDCKGIPKVSIESIKQHITETKYTSCPKCGSKMVIRNGRYGIFYSCTQYPKCRGTRNLK